MCGRFVLIATGRIIAEQFQLDHEPVLEPRYNIAPSQPIAAIRLDPALTRRELIVLRWGLIPFWAKDPKIGYKMINARSESVVEKPAFRSAFKQRRCLILADGFYEWEKRKKPKQPYLFRMKDQKPFAFAGLWEHWEGGEGEIIESCTILTTDANDLVITLHDRMPVILSPDDYASWIDPNAKKPEMLGEFLVPYPADEMQAYPVTNKVNRPSYDEPDCIRPVAVYESLEEADFG